MNNMDNSDGRENNNPLELTVLQEIYENSNLTQRKLSSQHDVALGSINIILKRLINKGFVKITEVHPKRFLYYLTPKGFKEKTRLTLAYINRSIRIYKDMKNHVEQALDEVVKDGYGYVVLCGVDDSFDIAYLAVMEKGLEIIGICDFNHENADKQKFHHSIQDASFIKQVSLDPACAFFICSVEREPILRKKLYRYLEDHDRIYSII